MKTYTQHINEHVARQQLTEIRRAKRPGLQNEFKSNPVKSYVKEQVLIGILVLLAIFSAL